MSASFFSSNRDLALAHLEARHPSRLDVVSKIFGEIDACLDVLESNSAGNPLAEACGIALVKGKNFAVCSLGLIFDGYGQEAGALVRLLVEHIELLEYLRMFPEEAQNALADGLPSAGARAKRINGSFQFLRDFLNKNSSHGSFSAHSVGHVLGLDGSINKRPNFGAKTFDENFRMVALFSLLLLRSAVTCVELISADAFVECRARHDSLMGRARHVFDFPWQGAGQSGPYESELKGG